MSGTLARGLLVFPGCHEQPACRGRLALNVALPYSGPPPRCAAVLRKFCFSVVQMNLYHDSHLVYLFPAGLCPPPWHAFDCNRTQIEQAGALPVAIEMPLDHAKKHVCMTDYVAYRTFSDTVAVITCSYTIQKCDMLAAMTKTCHTTGNGGEGAAWSETTSRHTLRGAHHVESSAKGPDFTVVHAPSRVAIHDEEGYAHSVEDATRDQPE